MTVIQRPVPVTLPREFDAMAIANEQATEDIQKNTVVNPNPISGGAEWDFNFPPWQLDALAILNEQASEEAQKSL